MFDESGHFKRSLLRMLQTGAFQKFLDCEAGQTAAVAFHFGRVYRIDLHRRTMVVEEQDREAVRRQIRGQWKPLGHPYVSRNRVVLDRRTGKILRAPGWGVAKSLPRQLQSSKKKSPYQLVSVRTVFDRLTVGLPS